MVVSVGGKHGKQVGTIRQLNAKELQEELRA